MMQTIPHLNSSHSSKYVFANVKVIQFHRLD